MAGKPPPTSADVPSTRPTPGSGRGDKADGSALRISRGVFWCVAVVVFQARSAHLVLLRRIRERFILPLDWCPIPLRSNRQQGAPRALVGRRNDHHPPNAATGTLTGSNVFPRGHGSLCGRAGAREARRLFHGGRSATYRRPVPPGRCRRRPGVVCRRWCCRLVVSLTRVYRCHRPVTALEGRGPRRLSARAATAELVGTGEHQSQ